MYIIANRKHGALYTVVTADMSQRIVQHREREGSKHARKCEIFGLSILSSTRNYRRHRPGEAHQEAAQAWKVEPIERRIRTDVIYSDLNR